MVVGGATTTAMHPNLIVPADHVVLNVTHIDKNSRVHYRVDHRDNLQAPIHGLDIVVVNPSSPALGAKDIINQEKLKSTIEDSQLVSAAAPSTVNVTKPNQPRRRSLLSKQKMQQ